MKNLFMVVTALLLVTVSFAEDGPNRRGSADGAGVWQGPAEKFFITARNTSGGAVVVGDVCILDTAQDDGYSCTTTTTASQTGHCVFAEACADDAYCKCQTQGLASVLFNSTGDNAVAGGPVFISEAVAGSVTAITTVGVSDFPIGVFMDSAAVSGTATVYLKLR